MISRIKQLKPSKHSRYEQGYINPTACKKLFDSQRTEPIIFRSSYERRFVNWLESNPNVKHWGSECVRIPYTYVDNQTHGYYPDYVVEMQNGDVILIEIKPKNQTIKPDVENTWAYDTYMRNMCKWKAAKKYCEDRKLKFQILTEDTIMKL